MSPALADVTETVATRRVETLARPVHSTRNAAILGISLGIAFFVCFATGLLSHALQHPPSWFTWPPRPAGLYRVSQGVHVGAGTIAIPLLIAKLWTVFPKFFEPLARDLPTVLERISLLPLVGGSLFMLFTGFANVARWYPLGFSFPAAHYWVAWITIGALIVHIGARQAQARRSLAERPDDTPTDDVSTSGAPPAVARRTLLWWAGGAAAVLGVTTWGQTLPILRSLTFFAPRRPDIGSQGLPVNKAAAEARFDSPPDSPDWTLTLQRGGRVIAEIDLASLEAMARSEAELPIACVEGWSASARWSGVRLSDVLRENGITDHEAVDVVSLERDSPYTRSTLTRSQADDTDTLLALDLNGERLNLDHGYPVRLIAPNRPGVLQTKWISRLEIR